MKSIYLLLIILISTIFNSLPRQPLYKCEHKSEEILPSKVSTHTHNEKRRIESDEFREFHIYLDLENIKKDIRLLELTDNEDFFISSMNKSVEILQSLLNIKPLRKDYYLSDYNLKSIGITEWEKDKFGDEAESKGNTLQSLGIDLAIFGKFEDLGQSTLATASAKYVQDTEINKGQPYCGLVKINKNVNYSSSNAKEYFQSILVHEFTHILGFSKNFFEDYYKNIFTKIDDYGIKRYYLNSPKLLEIARKYYNCPELEGVELENQGGKGTEASHWEARILLGEYMNGYSYTEEQVISEFTLAVLEDSGYYKPNYYTGGLMRFGKHKGCQFLKEKCINPETKKMNPNFGNEFYDYINPRKLKEASCSSGRQSRTYKAWYEAPEDLPNEYNYFQNNIAGYEPADFCPIFLKDDDEENISFYSGHCSKKGSGIYGNTLQYLDYGEYTTFNSSSEALANKTGEVLSDHSFCFLSSIVNPSYQDSEFISKIVRANCYEIFCSDRSLTLKIFNDYIVCPREGGKIKIDGYLGYLLCPDYNLMCSGSILCNDPFDCIKKESKIKDINYEYDYEIKTTQSVENIKYFSTNNYELSKNGKCAQNCKYCKENIKCIKCRDEYGLILDNEGNIQCESNNILSIGYYKNETTNYYEKCMNHCESCKNKKECKGCENGYIYTENKDGTSECILSDDPNQLINHCFKYDKNKKCKQCNENYGFNGTNKDICLSIKNENELAKYYSKDNGISYYPCFIENPNCTRCYYNNNTYGVYCTKCINNLILLNKQKGICLTMEEIENNKRYYFINETHAGDCSKTFNNCIYCDDDITCTKCKYGYTFIPKENNINNKSECVKDKMVEELSKNINIDNKDKNEEKKKITTNTNKERRKVKKNNSNYFSFINIIKLQAIFALFVLVN